MAKIAVIGSGFAGISAAAYLGKAGHTVEVFEKNSSAGGRARQLKTDNGYVFDMGPSWYWMPDIFEKFFNDFDFTAAGLYELLLLDPSFEMVFNKSDKLLVPAGYSDLRSLFETIETGAGKQLDRFMNEAGAKYTAVIDKLSKMPGISLLEFMDSGLMKTAIRYSLFSNFHSHVRKFFSDPKLIALMEFPILFLGAMPRQTPSLYSMMNYAGLKLGTWYPKGGFGKVIEAMKIVAEEQGCRFHFNVNVQKITVRNEHASGIEVNGSVYGYDAVIAAADYHHVESKLIPEGYGNYDEAYWKTRVFAPSCLIFYVGLKKKLPLLHHHTLFFEEDLELHTKEIYVDPQWPSAPLFYVCCPSRTDNTVAPEGHENLFFLMPIAVGLEDSEDLREKYFNIMLSRLEKHTRESNLKQEIDFKSSYCVSNFIADYNAYKGNAYGLANTLLQTAVMKPKIRNRRIVNLFYAGQLTVPGPGVPPSLISGKLASEQAIKFFKKKGNEIII